MDPMDTKKEVLDPFSIKIDYLSTRKSCVF